VKTAATRRLFGPRFGLIALGLVVSAFFGYLALRHVRAHETWRALERTDYAWLVPAVLVFMLALYMRALRWWSLYEPSRRPPQGDVVRATFIGYLANSLLPARAGEAAKAVALNRSAHTPIAESAATILIERVFDVLSLIFLLFVMLPWLPAVSWVRGAGLVAAVALVGVVLGSAVVLRYGERPVRFVLRPLHWLPFLPAGFAERAPKQFVHGLAGVLRVRIAAVAFLWTTASWIVLGLSNWLVMVAFHLHPSPLAAELVVIGIGLAMVLPSSPAALGVFEAATVTVLAAYHVDASSALSYALVLHAVNVLPLFAVALAALGVRRLRRIVPGAAMPDAELQLAQAVSPPSSALEA
jgi:uncharacterized protein (TIRG00374 family)